MWRVYDFTLLMGIVGIIVNQIPMYIRIRLSSMSCDAHHEPKCAWWHREARTRVLCSAKCEGLKSFSWVRMSLCIRRPISCVHVKRMCNSNHNPHLCTSVYETTYVTHTDIFTCQCTLLLYMTFILFDPRVEVIMWHAWCAQYMRMPKAIHSELILRQYIFFTSFHGLGIHTRPWTRQW